MRSRIKSVSVVEVSSLAAHQHVLAVVDVTDSRATELNRQIVSTAASLAGERGTMMSVLVLAANDAPLRDRVEALCRWYCARTDAPVDARWLPRLGSVESVLPDAAERYGADVVVVDSLNAAVAHGSVEPLLARAS